MQPVAAPMCVETEMLHAFVAGSMERGRFYLPDGPRIAAAALVDVAADTSGVLGALPVLDAAAALDVASAEGRAARRMLALHAPFVLRGHAAALRVARSASWRDGTSLCAAAPSLCADQSSSKRWRWRGWQMLWKDPTAAVDDAWDRTTYVDGKDRSRASKVEVEQNVSLSTYVSELSTAPVAATVGAVGETTAVLPPERVLWQGTLDPYGDVSRAEGLLEALAPFGALAEGFEGKLSVRVGRQAYGALFHLDLPSNWVLAVAGPKRAVLLHPYEQGCLAVSSNHSHESYRQSPAPILALSDWLAKHCAAADFDPPLAMQHVFEEGDLLHIPALWIHSIETAPAEREGWLVSLNRFFGDHTISAVTGGRDWTECKVGETLFDPRLWPAGWEPLPAAIDGYQRDSG